jgi:competence protein ComEC
MPRTGWFAAGAAGASLAVPWLASLGAEAAAIALAVAAPLVALTAVCAALAKARPPSSARRRCTSAAAVAFGAALVAFRLALVAPGHEVPTLPSTDGPWSASVLSVGSPRDGRQVATLALDRPSGPRVYATLPRYPEVVAGESVLVDGSLEPPPDDDFGSWLRRTGVAGTLRARTLSPGVGAERGSASPIEALRRGSDEALRTSLPEPAAGLASGILVGLRERVDRALAADFTTAGVSHVVAISGWNIAIVGATVTALLRSRGRRVRSIATIAVVVVYTLFAGASPSVVRAAAMAGVVLLARESGRAGQAATALGLAAGLLLVADPGMATDAGFQLSVLATAGLLAWATPTGVLVDRWTGGRLPAWLTETLSLSLAAQLATLPVVLGSFGRLSLVAPAANLMIAPLVAPAMALGLAALLGGWVAQVAGWGAVATAGGLPGWLVLTILITLVETAASIPGASVAVPPPLDVLAGVGAGLVAIALAPALRPRLVGRLKRPAGPGSPEPASARRRTDAPRRRSTRLVGLALAVAVAGVAVAAIRMPDGRTRVTVLDVGQGDAILLEGERGGRMLVDGGPDPDRLLIALDARLPPWDRRLDLVVLTHPHEDHVAGLPLLLERYRVGRVLEPGMRGPGPSYRALTTWLTDRGVKAERLSTGDRLRVDTVELEVVWPDAIAVQFEPPDEGREINGVSVVLLGRIGTGRFLLTGDAEDDVDPTLVSRGLPRVDLLKVAHHGSRTASSAAFLGAVRPAVAVISVGADNPYGHPARETIGRLDAVGARVLRTDLDGSVTATFDGRAWAVRTEHQRPSERSTEAAAAGAGRTVERRPDGRAAALATALGYHRHSDPAPARPRRRDPAGGRPTRVGLLLGRRRIRARTRGGPSCRAARRRDRTCPGATPRRRRRGLDRAARGVGRDGTAVRRRHDGLGPRADATPALDRGQGRGRPPPRRRRPRQWPGLPSAGRRLRGRTGPEGRRRPRRRSPRAWRRRRGAQGSDRGAPRGMDRGARS